MYVCAPFVCVCVFLCTRVRAHARAHACAWIVEYPFVRMSGVNTYNRHKPTTDRPPLPINSFHIREHSNRIKNIIHPVPHTP